MPHFEWDADKNSRNQQAHQISFTEAEELWRGTHVIIPAKNVLGENRWAILGKIKQKLYIAIFTKRDEVIRLISCHQADSRWRKIYEKFVSEKTKKE